MQAYLPHKPSFNKRVSLELRKGTKTRPFFLALPSALIHSANASKDLQHCTTLFSFTNVFIMHAIVLLLCMTSASNTRVLLVHRQSCQSDMTSANNK